MNQKRIIILSCLVIAILVLSLGVTFAIFTYTKTSNTNSELVLGDIYMHYNETNQLTIENAMPFDGSKYFHNADITEEEVNICVSYLTSIWGAEEVGSTVREGETYATFCDGTGTYYGATFQQFLNTNSFKIECLIYFEDNNVIKAAYSNLPYFEFTINGKNTTLDKNIYYEIKLDYGDILDDKQTRIEDNLLKFALIEYNNNIQKRILTDYSFPNLENQVIWSNTIESEINEEIERTYRLYMWIDSNTKICSGELTTDCDYYTNQNPNWDDVFASIRVNVSGDFIEKDVHYNVLTNNLLSGIEVAKENISEINFLNLSNEEINDRYQTSMFKSNGVHPRYEGDNIKIWLESDTEDNTKYIMNIASDEVIYFPSDSSILFAQYTSVKNINFSNIDTSNVTNMGFMFYNCNSLTSLDLSNFDTSKVTTMRAMFYGCSNLISIDVSSFNTTKVTDMYGMFYKCTSLKNIDVSSFETRNVTNMSGIFGECNSLTSLDLSNFDTRNVTDMTSMVIGCNSLSSLDVSSFDTSNVTSMRAMFADCSRLTVLDVSNFDTSKVTTMAYMFYGCSNLNSLDVSGFDTIKVIDMNSIFYGCSNLTSLDVSGFDTSKVTDMNSMFRNCSNLTNLDVSNFDTSKVTTMAYMFYGCKNLITIYANSDWNTTKVSQSGSMFTNCTNLVGAISYDASKVTVLYANPTTGYFTNIN